MNVSVSAIAAPLMLIFAFAANADGFCYTRTSGKGCVDQSRALAGAWSCPGPGGHSAEFFDDGNVAGFGIRLPGERSARSPYVWRGAEKVFGDRVEWRFDEGRPTSAVLRIWRTASDDDGRERNVSELVVFRIGAKPCRISSIDAGQRGANEAAHAIMLELDRPCAPDSGIR